MAQTFEDISQDVRDMVEDLVDNIRRHDDDLTSLLKTKISEWSRARGHSDKTVEKFSDAVDGASDATKEFGRGMMSLMQELGNSNAEFSQLNGIIGSVGGAFSSLLDKIPVIGGVFSSFADAATQTLQFAVSQVQEGFSSFQELGKVGIIGAEGMTGFVRSVEETGIPMARLTKMLSEGSDQLAYIGGSAVEGGKLFRRTMKLMQAGVGDDLRMLGYSIEEIGETTMNYAERQRKLGNLEQMSQAVLAAKTREYGIELDKIAKLTGMSREALQAELDDQLRDQRYRAFLAGLNENEAREHQAYIAALKQSAPEVAKAAMDTAAGFYNTQPAIQAAVSGYTQTFQENNKRILEGGKGMDAYGKTIEQAKRNVDVKGFQRQLTLVAGDNSPLFNFSQQMDLAGKNVAEWDKIQAQVVDDQKKQIEDATGETGKLVDAQKKLEASIARVNAQFAGSSMAIDVIDGFATAIDAVTKKIFDVLNDEEEAQPAGGGTRRQANRRRRAIRARENREAELAQAKATIEGDRAALEDAKARLAASPKARRRGGRARANPERNRILREIRDIEDRIAKSEDIMENEQERLAEAKKREEQQKRMASRRRNRGRRTGTTKVPVLSPKPETEIANTNLPAPDVPPEALKPQRTVDEDIALAESILQMGVELKKMNDELKAGNMSRAEYDKLSAPLKDRMKAGQAELNMSAPAGRKSVTVSTPPDQASSTGGTATAKAATGQKPASTTLSAAEAKVDSQNKEDVREMKEAMKRTAAAAEKSAQQQAEGNRKLDALTRKVDEQTRAQAAKG